METPHCPLCESQLSQEEVQLHCCETCEAFFKKEEIKYYDDNPDNT
jgi:hypothetical protein